MHRTVLVVLVVALLSGCGSKSEPVPKGRFTTSYAAPENAEHRETYEVFRKEKILDDFASGLNDFLALPQDIKLSVAECGQPNAFYHPDSRSITLCYELIDELVEQAVELELDDEETENFIAGSIIFVTLHEVGHALVHVLELPVTGKEEDAVDQLAAVLLMDSSENEKEFNENADLMSNAALWFGVDEPADVDEEDYADEHSLNPQRYYNLMCWIYGANPKAGADIVEDELLPKARAERCVAEYAQISRAWEQLLKPHAR